MQKYVETRTLSDEDAWEADARAKRPGMSRAEATDYYNQVAKELYEEYLNRQRYRGPVIAAEAVADFFPENCRDSKLVLDFAAGTGFVGEELRRLGFKKLHCLEPSRGMLDVAHQKKIYMREYCCYLDHNPLPMDDNLYDCAVCSGGFGEAAIPTAGLQQLVRVVKPGGLVCMVVSAEYLDEVPEYRNRLEPLMADMEQTGLWRLLSRTPTPNYYFNLPCVVFKFVVC